MDYVAKSLNNRRLQGFKEILNTCTVDDIVAQMITDGVFTKEDQRRIASSSDPKETLFIALETAKKEDKIQILDYHWQLLPWIEVELVMVTNNGIHRYAHKES